MCGINGILSKKGIKDLQLRLENMNNALLHRGPDDGGKLCNDTKTAGFGHRRLSIIDPDRRSSQPMTSASGRWIIVYNGEIYNFHELRAECDYPFRTESDTEAVLAYIERYGVAKMLKRANGMYAVGAYDTYEKKLYLARDRMGIKPLYYYSDGDKFIFSSEIKGILRSGLVRAVPDEAATDDYLGYRYVREPYTFFEGIYQAEAGTYMVIDSGINMQVYHYWHLPETFNTDTEYDENGITEEFRIRLEDAVLKRTVSDVPLGTYLSGGVDSGLLTAIAAKAAMDRLNTYTVGFPELNEFEYSDMTSRKYNTVHHKIIMNADEYFDRMKEVISYKDAPLGVPNEIPLAVMSGELKKKITVVLSGEGADELLGGYGRIFRSPFEYANGSRKEEFYDFFIGKYEYVPRKIRDKFLAAGPGRREKYDEAVRESFGRHCNEYNVFNFFHKYHVKGLLQRVDTTTMLASVEARVPFLDHELIEYVYENVPYDMKLRFISPEAEKKAAGLKASEFSEKLDIPKYLLKKLALDYIPEEVVNRKKEGFPVPLKNWKDDISCMVRKKLAGADWIKQRNTEELMEACRQYGNGDQLLWMFLNVQCFMEMYFTKEWRY